VIGLKQPIAHFVVNEYNQRVRSGEKQDKGDRFIFWTKNPDLRSKINLSPLIPLIPSLIILLLSGALPKGVFR